VFNIYCIQLEHVRLRVVCTTNFIPGSATQSAFDEWPTDQPYLPPMIVNAYASVLDLLHQILPTTIHNTLNLAYTAITHTLTPSILTSLLYRIFVLYAATRIIPAVRGVSQEFTSEPDLDSPEPVHTPSLYLMTVFQINERLYPIFSNLSHCNLHKPITVYPGACRFNRWFNMDLDLLRYQCSNRISHMAMDKHICDFRIIFS
jgi:ICE2